jgi:uncharacterized membrane protein
MATRANIKSVLEDEAHEENGMATLPIELDAIPGAVWQAELQSLMPEGMRVSLFEQGARKCALLRFPTEQRPHASQAFAQALQGANEVSQQAHQAARAAVEALGAR